MSLISLVLVAVIAVGMIESVFIEPPCVDLLPAVCPQLCINACPRDIPSVGLALERRKRYDVAPPPPPPAPKKIKVDVKTQIKKIQKSVKVVKTAAGDSSDFIYALCPKSCGRCQNALDFSAVARKYTINICEAPAAPQEAPVGLALE